MNDITQAQLEEVVTYYVNENDKPTARNYIESWGPRIPGYNIIAGLQQLAATQPTTTTSENNPVTPVTPQNENKPIETGTPAQATTQPAEIITAINAVSIWIRRIIILSVLSV
jgi:hypothetical protein